MSWARRAAMAGCLALTLVLLPILHCRKSEIQTLDPGLVFPLGESPETSPEEASTPRSREAVPLAGRFVVHLPRDPEPWRWAAADGVTLGALFRGTRPIVLLYAEPMGSGPWSSLGLDGFLRTVAPELSSTALPFFGTRIPGAREGLEQELDLTPAAAVDFLSRARSRTFGRGLGFHGRRSSFGGWRWSGSNAHGVELRLGAFDGMWGEQEELPSRMPETLGELRHVSPSFPELSISRSHEPSSPGRAARMVLGTARRRSGIGLYLAILHTAEPEASVAADLGALLDTLRPPRGGEMETLLAARTPGDLERLAGQVSLDLQIAPRRISEEDLKALGRHFEERQAEPR